MASKEGVKCKQVYPYQVIETITVNEFDTVKKIVKSSEIFAQLSLFLLRSGILGKYFLSFHEKKKTFTREIVIINSLLNAMTLKKTPEKIEKNYVSRFKFFGKLPVANDFFIGEILFENE